MRFRFRLERILHLIQLQEMLKKMEVAAWIQKIEASEKERKAMAYELRDVLYRQQSEMEHGARATAFHIEKGMWNIECIKKWESEIEELKNILQGKKLELLRIALRRRALESLRQKRWIEHRLAERRREQKALDEGFRLAQLDQ